MPNHCQNELYLSGDTADVNAVLEFLKGDDKIDFNKIKKQPEFEGDQDWNVANWGTKWNAYRVEVIKDEAPFEGIDFKKVVIHFQTAWSPPTELFKEVIKAFPKVDITLEYFEQGMAYCGGVTAWETDDGHVLKEWEGEYFGSKGG